jgi:hypothetical protein
MRPLIAEHLPRAFLPLGFGLPVLQAAPEQTVQQLLEPPDDRSPVV